MRPSPGGITASGLSATTLLLIILGLVAVEHRPALASEQPGTMPVVGLVYTEFDPPEPDWMPGHRGLDLTVSVGDRVRAPRLGVVGFVGEIAGVPIMTIWHGRARSTYQPVETKLLPGQMVQPGDVIGHIVAAGQHCDVPCLHWGLRIDDVYLDPRLLLGGGRVRLISVHD